VLLLTACTIFGETRRKNNLSVYDMIDGGGGICEDAAKNGYCIEKQIDRLITCHVQQHA